MHGPNILTTQRWLDAFVECGIDRFFEHAERSMDERFSPGDLSIPA